MRSFTSPWKCASFGERGSCSIDGFALFGSLMNTAGGPIYNSQPSHLTTVRRERLRLRREPTIAHNGRRAGRAGWEQDVDRRRAGRLASNPRLASFPSPHEPRTAHRTSTPDRSGPADSPLGRDDAVGPAPRGRPGRHMRDASWICARLATSEDRDHALPAGGPASVATRIGRPREPRQVQALQLTAAS